MTKIEKNMKKQFKNIAYKIFDKTFPLSTGVYGAHRSQQAEVQQNYRAIKAALENEDLLILNHIHGNTVIDADVLENFKMEFDADGSVTSKKGIILSIQSADCVPILLFDDEHAIIGGCHCGWKSAKAGVLENALELMKKKGAKNISAIIGPAIHQEYYEVGLDFYEAILMLGQEYKALFKAAPTSAKWFFDLPGFVKQKLIGLGVSEIIDHCEDTYTNEAKYYSYRRDLHNNQLGKQTNILSTILIR